MSRVWTAVVSCCHCNERFILNQLSVDKLAAAVAGFPCPHCETTPTFNNPHEVLNLSVANLPFRKPEHDSVWHYSQHCSGWPMDDYLEIDFPPLAEICRECRALVGS
jgi:hypothetical protein